MAIFMLPLCCTELPVLWVAGDKCLFVFPALNNLILPASSWEPVCSEISPKWREMSRSGQGRGRNSIQWNRQKKIDLLNRLLHVINSPYNVEWLLLYHWSHNYCTTALSSLGTLGQECLWKYAGMLKMHLGGAHLHFARELWEAPVLSAGELFWSSAAGNEWH